jgi:phosphoglucomutase
LFRLSGTGSSGATVRLYCDSYEGPTGNISGNPQDVLKAIVEIALKISELKEFTGREEPTVIT